MPLLYTVQYNDPQVKQTAKGSCAFLQGIGVSIIIFHEPVCRTARTLV